MEYPIKVELKAEIDSPRYNSHGFKKLQFVFQVPSQGGLIITIVFDNTTKNIFIDISNYKNIIIDILSDSFILKSVENNSFYLK